jgi:hypothetical protein
MSRIGSYKTTAFSELQKFLVLDPSTSSASLVLASELVAYITPQIGSVKAESTRLSAENTDYKVGEIIQTSGATVAGSLASLYLVVAGGAGDFPMINGNDLLDLIGDGDEVLRAQLISQTAGQGASLVSIEGGPTVESAIGQGVLAWSGTRTYQINSFANRAGVLYICKTADHISATAPESDATNWRLIDASDVAYDNFTSGLTAENSQDAIDEIVSTYYTKTASDARFVAVDVSATGTATFTNSTNNIFLSGVGSITGLEVGDVIKVLGSVSNNTEFTVEVITDTNNVIVNQAHAGGSTGKSLVSEASTAGVNIKLLSKWYEAPAGLGQSWVSLSASRAFNTTYTNALSRTISISLQRSNQNSTSFEAFTDGVSVGFVNLLASGDSGASAVFPVTSGSVYSCTSNGTLRNWAELR